MWTLYWTAATAAPPAVSTEADARYVMDYGGAATALGWLRERMVAEPAEGKWALLYLEGLAREPAQRHRALPAAAVAWGAGSPDWAGVVEAYAWGVAGMPADLYSSTPFIRAGDWCEPAYAALARLPEAGAARFRTLKARVDVARVCNLDGERDKALLREESLAGVLGPFRAAVVGLEDGVDPADAEQVKAAVAAEPFRLRDLAKYAAPDSTGPAAAEVREWMLAQARAQLALGAPEALWTAARVFSVAKRPDEERAARVALAAADPDNDLNRSLLDKLGSDEGVDPTTILDVRERLTTMLAADPPRGDGFVAVTWWSAVADASEQLGDADTFFQAAEHLAHLERRFAVRLATASIAADRRLGRAERRLDRWLDEVADPPDALAGFDGADTRASVAERWAEALDARAAVRAARGDREGAIADLEQAVVIDGFTAERRVRLATWVPPDFSRRAQALAAAVAEAPDDPRTPALRSALDEALRASATWLPPEGADAFVAAVPTARDAVEAPEAPLDGSAFHGFEVTIDGAQTRLLDLPGPLVIDLWATWCGPCVQSMPHLADLQRQWEGKVTIVAVSVDENPAKAAAFLAARGGAGFTVAYAGGEGMRKLGVNGIPATFVFDADHRLVGRTTGWGPGNTELDEEIAKMMR